MDDREALRAAAIAPESIREAVQQAFEDGAIWGLRSVRKGQTGADMIEAAKAYASRNAAIAQPEGGTRGR